MKVYGTTIQQLEQAAEQVPCKLLNVQQRPTYIQFVIRPTAETDESLRSTGRYGRRIAALSWYGHKVFMDALFAINPQIKLTSSGYDLTYNKRTNIVYDGLQ